METSTQRPCISKAQVTKRKDLWCILYGEAQRLCNIENYKQIYVELERFVFSRTSRLTNVSTVYRVPMPIDPKKLLRKQGRHPNTPSVLSKMEKVGEIEVVDVRDNAESRLTHQREEESLMNENVEILIPFY